ncbi:hypothetical protein BWQ96_07031 [Gracilariopsis chorda]|uniref:Chromo domain-containing protein n=1 Tax=Gracilariopsis chorda TaxID=448386 RepID=A0A2V3IM99_9FLOR|nr:hypothetical protein BWQ96_07031 [Gracilariopsis chorda]|eukprot:PXF43202.1 hypothetical protein BWQ96_07031 [Gracilariopsis chorda]
MKLWSSTRTQLSLGEEKKWSAYHLIVCKATHAVAEPPPTTATERSEQRSESSNGNVEAQGDNATGRALDWRDVKEGATAHVETVKSHEDRERKGRNEVQVARPQQKLVSADPTVGEVGQEREQPITPAIVSPDLERPSWAILRRTVTKEVTSSPTESVVPNVGLGKPAKPERKQESRRLAIRSPSAGISEGNTVDADEKSSNDIDVEGTQRHAYQGREPSSTDRDIVPAEELDSEREYVIERIVFHGRDADNCLLCKVRWYGYAPSSDTLEPIGNLPRPHVLSYCKRANLAIPDNIDDARVG